MQIWNLPLVRLAVRLTGLGLNAATLRDLLSATDLGAALIAAAWLVPWDRITPAAYRRLATKRLLRSAHAPLSA